MLTHWLAHCHKQLCLPTLQCDTCSNKWYTRARLLLRRGYNAYQANELNAEKITTFSDHLNYEAVVQVLDNHTWLTLESRSIRMVHTCSSVPMCRSVPMCGRS